jgi:hypothetical protein
MTRDVVACTRRAIGQEIEMAKGQVRKNKEVRKPKAEKPKGAKSASVTDVFAKGGEDATHNAKKKTAA